MANDLGGNLRRLMAQLDLTIDDVCRLSGLDKRTVTAVLEGRTRPRAHTISQLARGLDVPVDEFFLDTAQLAYRRFDSHTNPAVEEVVQSHPELFQGWTREDYDELHSRHATGGPMTVEGTLQTVRRMNEHRVLHQRLSVLLETADAETVAMILNGFYEKNIARE